MRLRIDLAYDGGGFYGWAVQPDIRTVQGEIEQALHRILRVDPNDASEPLRLVVAGRTDTGVHASHQVCHIDMSPDILERAVGHMKVPAVTALEHRLQRVLPDDITIHRISEAPVGFDARFSALERTYVYRIADRSSEVDPRLRGCVLHIDGDLDIEAMNLAAAQTIGLHDFGSFAGATVDCPADGGGGVCRADIRIGIGVLHHRRRCLRPEYGTFAGQWLCAGWVGQARSRLVQRQDGRSQARRQHGTDRTAGADLGTRRLPGRRSAGCSRAGDSGEAHLAVTA